MMTDKTESFYFYSASFPKILHELNCSIIFSTYQAGKLVILSSGDGKSLRKFARPLKRPMGIAIDERQSRMAVSTKSEITIYKNNSNLAKTYPPAPGIFEHLFIPTIGYKTGLIDTHEIVFGGENVFFVNTLFSCISKPSRNYHFEAIWKPPFISELIPEDRCHLNGLAVKNGKPKYASMFSETNTSHGWRHESFMRGLIYDIDKEVPILKNLSLPHSPIYFRSKLYFLQSALGEVSEYDLVTKSLKTLHKTDGFVRGLEVTDNYIILAKSKIRPSSKSFGHLPIAQKDTKCGIEILKRKSGKRVALLEYHDKISEIFGLRIYNNSNAVGILTADDPYYDKCITIEKNHNYWMKPKIKQTQ